MSFTYDAGSSTPGYDGLIEINATSPVIRLNSASPPDTPSTATFRLSSNPLLDSSPVRSAIVPLGADTGGLPGPFFRDVWQFTIPGWLSVPSGPGDVPAAQDMLKAAFAMDLGPLELIVNALGWSTRRFVIAWTSGPVVFGPHHSMLMIPTRSFQIPMVAPDPLQYDADNLKTAALPMDNSHVTLTNAGDAGAPFTARFTGPFNTAASLIRNSDGAEITLSMSLTAGQYVDVTTNAAGNAVISATKSDGTNVWNKVTAYGLLRVAPGANSWRAAGSSGTTGASAVTVTWRDAW